MSKNDDQTLFELLFELERSLMSPSIRKNRQELENLLGNDFFEFGSSGTRWSREMVLKALSQEDAAEFEAFDFNARRLSTDCIQVTYKTKNISGTTSSSASLRSSIWKKDQNKWQMIFHQGTPIK